MKITIFKKLFKYLSKNEQAKHNTKGELIEVESKDHFMDLITTYSWSPFTFVDNYRKRANFIDTSLLVLDIDDGMPLSSAIGQVKILGYKCVIGTSLSHQIPKNGIVADRYRLVFPLSYPIADARTYAATWKGITQAFKAGDPNCKDLARFYYPCKEVAYQEGHRKFPVIEAEYEEVIEGDDYEPQSEERGVLSTRTRAFLDKGAPAGLWHQEFLLACRDLKAQNYTFSEAYNALVAVTGRLDNSHDIPQLQYAYSNRDVSFRFRREEN